MKFHSAGKRGEGRRKRNGAAGDGNRLGFIVRSLVIASALFVVTVYRVTLKTETETMNRQAAKIRHQLRVFDRELAHLRIEGEKLKSWKHVSRSVKNYKLGLKIPSPRQVRWIGDAASAPNGARAGREPVLLSRR